MYAINYNANAARAYAFFDVDDTLISVKSMLSFQDFWYQVRDEREAERRYRQDLKAHMHEEACWSHLNRLYYRHFAGRPVAEVAAMGERWYRLMKKQTPVFFHSVVVATLRAHQARGEEPVFVSGSFPALLDPLARELGVNHSLATRMEVRDGVYTGEILPPQTIGPGKAEAIELFLQAQAVDANACYAYGDDWSDLPMLRAVGRPVIVAGGRKLESLAQQEGWPVLQPH